MNDLPRAIVAGSVIIGTVWAVGQVSTGYAWLLGIVVLLGVITFNAGTFSAQLARIMGG